MQDLITGKNARLFLQEDPGPASAPEYQELARAGAVDQDFGARTPIRSFGNRYGTFENVGITRAAPGLPQLTVESRLGVTKSNWLELGRRGCPVALHVHVGECENPEDFNGGWKWKRVIEGAELANYSTGDLQAFDESGDTPTTETLPFSGLNIYDISQIRASEQASAAVTDEVVGIRVADAIACGACGAPSDGCSVVVAVVSDTSGSPGLPAEVLYTQDGGVTWASSAINSMDLADSPTDIIQIGDNVIVLDVTSSSLHHTTLAALLAGTALWTEVTTGFDPAGFPEAISSAAATASWIAGQAGRIYFTSDPTSSVTEQADGTLTASDLKAIHALDRNNVLAGGDAGALLSTNNGGAIWTLITPPAVFAIEAVWMRSATEWYIGGAGGNLWYTRDSGITWTQKAFPGSGDLGTVWDIEFATELVGYMSYAADNAGLILRTTDGGNSWYVLPEEAGNTIPANDRINRITTCGYEDVNVVYGGGLGDDATDGVMVKFA